MLSHHFEQHAPREWSLWLVLAYLVDKCCSRLFCDKLKRKHAGLCNGPFYVSVVRDSGRYLCKQWCLRSLHWIQNHAGTKSGSDKITLDKRYVVSLRDFVHAWSTDPESKCLGWLVASEVLMVHDFVIAWFWIKQGTKSRGWKIMQQHIHAICAWFCFLAWFSTRLILNPIDLDPAWFCCRRDFNRARLSRDSWTRNWCQVIISCTVRTWKNFYFRYYDNGQFVKQNDFWPSSFVHLYIKLLFDERNARGSAWNFCIPGYTA